MSSPSKSIACVSMHKAGSTITDQILVDFCTARGLEMDRISLIAPSSPLPLDQVYIQHQKQMRDEGVYYGVIRGPWASRMPKLKDLKVIVQVRDPRDCITSAYFSYRQSHVPPKDSDKLKAFLERREAMKEMNIDEYARGEISNYRNRLQVLRNLVEEHNDVLVLKYEEMVLNTESWLNRISDFIDQPLTNELRVTLGEKIDFTPKNEDPSKHKRQVTPGDHLRKMSPETIDALDEGMANQMQFFGYQD
ncbi:sulfotransferase domain-containing protein [Pseudodonghicola flavimaris]|uniref:Sulfotransferase domain-containing protein n=1 Tax=Pseudodonghicola flavimaris TaxID=3050036 RepID=A0ABT7F8I1_9RHOB|nr:sulfotransferase domain-containing protein [Pseudodonghicola flavimaris]MDK3020922.1 sulfotransferase domain-containing protein [Pseudodonghicola flavimaris]